MAGGGHNLYGWTYCQFGIIAAQVMGALGQHIDDLTPSPYVITQPALPNLPLTHHRRCEAGNVSPE